MAKIKEIESSMKSEGTKPLKEKKKQSQKMKADAKSVASQFNTQEANVSKAKAFAIKSGEKLTNPNRLGEKKKGPGRQKGQKNFNKIKDADGKTTAIVNQHGVIFLVQEQRALKSAVDSLERKRKMLANNELGLLVGFDRSGKLTGDKDPLMTFEATKSMNQFKTHEDYFNYYNKIKEFTDRKYLTDVANDMKDRYLKTIQNTTGMTEKDFEKIKRKIDKMSTKEFAMRFGHNIFGTITEYYERADMTGGERRQQIINKKTKDMTQAEIDEYMRKQDEWDTNAGGSAANVDDIMARIGLGEDAIQVDMKNNRYTEYREDQKRKKEKQKMRKEQKLKENEQKYQEFLKMFDLEDTDENRSKFKHLRS